MKVFGHVTPNPHQGPSPDHELREGLLEIGSYDRVSKNIFVASLEAVDRDFEAVLEEVLEPVVNGLQAEDVGTLFDGLRVSVGRGMLDGDEAALVPLGMVVVPGKLDAARPRLGRLFLRNVFSLGALFGASGGGRVRDGEA